MKCQLPLKQNGYVTIIITVKMFNIPSVYKPDFFKFIYCLLMGLMANVVKLLAIKLIKFCAHIKNLLGDSKLYRFKLIKISSYRLF